jgi:hypothetical protein
MCGSWGHNFLVPTIYIHRWSAPGRHVLLVRLSTRDIWPHRIRRSIRRKEIHVCHRIQGLRVKPDIYALSAMDIQVASRDLAIVAHYVHDVIRMLGFSGYHGVRILGKIEIPQGLRIRGSPKPPQRDSERIHQACSPLNIESCNQRV